MGYNNSVLIKVAAELESRKRRAEAERQLRHDTAVAKIPEVAAFEHEMAMTGIAAVKAIGMGKDAEEYIISLSKINLSVQKKLRKALKNAGYPADYLDVKYYCPKCCDTGFVEGKSCSCRKALLKEYAMKQLGSLSPVQSCTFDSFDLDYYPDAVDEKYGISPRAHMKELYEYCKGYAEDFDTSSKSIYMHGSTGLGKTHLSLAIAGEATAKGWDVIYGSCQNLLNRLEHERFGGYRDNSEQGAEQEILGCDLLVIDDLGAEFSTTFTNAAIYNIINTRINCGLPVIISTNLTAKELEDKYSQRITSRIIGNYVSMFFIGRDIRQLKNGY